MHAVDQPVTDRQSCRIRTCGNSLNRLKTMRTRPPSSSRKTSKSCCAALLSERLPLPVQTTLVDWSGVFASWRSPRPVLAELLAAQRRRGRARQV